MKRRTFLKTVANGAPLIPLTAVGIPAVLSATAPLRSNAAEASWRNLGPLDEFPIGETTLARFPLENARETETPAARGVYVWRRTADEIVVFSRACTDLGCPVTWDAGSSAFFCPCHGGIFAQNGDRLAGPPKRALYRYEYRLREDALEIDVRSVPPIA